MGFLKTADARVVKPAIQPAEWESIRRGALSPVVDFKHKTAKVILEEYNPADFLLSHCTIIASVDTEPVNAPLGRHMVDGFQVERKYADYYITPETSKYINNNCFVSGTAILMADGTEKPIEQVQVGDEVVSHTGAIRRVTETFVHPFRGYLRSIKRLGDPRTLDVSPEHPFLAMTPATTCACGCGTALNRRARKAAVHRFQDYVRGHGAKPRLHEKPGFSWVSAALLDKGDFLSMPRLQGDVEAKGITPGKARLLGYYLAEGFYHRQKRHRVSSAYKRGVPEDLASIPVGVDFALNIDECDTLVKEIFDLLDVEFGVGASLSRVSDGGVTVHSQQSLPLVQFISAHATEYAKTKRLAAHVLRWPLALQRELVQGWIEGDGCVESTAGGWVSVTSASSDLISQMHVILGRLGVFATRGVVRTVGRKRVRVANGGFRVVNDPTKQTVAHRLQIGSVHAEALLGGSHLESLFKRSIRNRRKHALGFRVDAQRTMFPIRSVTKRAYEGSVYNFETEIDHSYVANGVAVHNSDSWERKLLLSCFKSFIGAENYCFVPGTMITMSDGSQRAIQNIRVGDEVFTHEGRSRRVLRTFERDVEEEICSLYFDRHRTPIKCTKGHPFRKWAGASSQEWVEAGSLSQNESVLGPKPSEGDGTAHTVAWAGLEHYRGPVHNIEVEEDNSYVLGLAGVAVHNCEHIQIPELSKGKIIDAAARNLGDSVYVDILIATHRRHKPLVEAISSGRINTLSMGCSVSFTTCTKCGNVAEDEPHLCPHVRFFKGSEFVDELGTTRKIAELCGHLEAEPGSVKFIEASWVANPAFTGAVLRSILNPGEIENLKEKMQLAFSMGPKTISELAMSKAARSLSTYHPEILRLAFDLESQGQGEGQSQESFPNPTQGDVPVAPKKDDDDPIHKLVSELADTLRERAVEQIRKEIGQGEAAHLTGTPEDQNNTLVKNAFRYPAWRALGRVVLGMTRDVQATRTVVRGLVYYKIGGWKAVAKAGFTGREILGISRVIDRITKLSSMAGEARVYQTVLAVGGMAPHQDVETYLAACRRVLGRSISGSEAGALLEKGRLYSLGS